MANTSPTSQTYSFSLNFPASKVLDEYSVQKKSKITVTLDNIKVNRSGFFAQTITSCKTRTTVNDEYTDLKSNSSESSHCKITKAFDSPQEFLKAFGPIADDNTNIEFTININEPPSNAHEAVQKFYQLKLNKEKLDLLLTAVAAEITNKATKQNTDKVMLTRNITTYIGNQALHILRRAVSAHMIAILLFVLLLCATPWVAPMVNMSFPALLFIEACALTLVQSLISNIQAFAESPYLHKKVEVLRKLGELDNENMDTPANKNQLINKLHNLLTCPIFSADHEEFSKDNKVACKEALEIGQEVAAQKQKGWLAGNFALAKAFFMKNAYHPGYYIGEEIEKRRNATPKPALKS